MILHKWKHLNLKDKRLFVSHVILSTLWYALGWLLYVGINGGVIWSVVVNSNKACAIIGCGMMTSIFMLIGTIAYY